MNAPDPPATLTALLSRRRMCRHFLPEPLPDGLVERVARAALQAPSAGNTRSVAVLVLTEPADRDRFWRTTGTEPGSDWATGMIAAPALIMITTSRDAYRRRYAEPDKRSRRDSRHDHDDHADHDDHGPFPAPWWWIDAGMAAMAILLAAADEELGACFFGLPIEAIDAVQDAFGLPPDRSVAGMIALGRPDPGRRSRPARRAAAAPRMHRGSWPAAQTDVKDVPSGS